MIEKGCPLERFAPLHGVNAASKAGMLSFTHALVLGGARD